jgi:hypothetical protein
MLRKQFPLHSPGKSGGGAFATDVASAPLLFKVINVRLATGSERRNCFLFRLRRRHQTGQQNTRSDYL